MAIFTGLALTTGAIIKSLAKSTKKPAQSKQAAQFVKGGEEKKGGAIVRRQQTGIDKASTIMGGKSSALAVIDKPRIKVGFKDINTQIDNIVGQTVSIRKIVATQYALDKKNVENNRKSQENLKRKKREGELESKKRRENAKRIGIPGQDAVSNYFTNILLGAGILALIKNLDKIENSYQFLLKNAHKIWVGVRGGLSLLKLSIKNLLKFLRRGSAKVLSSITGKIGRGLKKGGGFLLKQFRKLATAIKTWGKVIIPNILKNISKGMKLGDAINDARKLASTVPLSRRALSGVKAGSQVTQSSRASRLINRKHGAAAQRIYDNAIANGKSVGAAKAAVDRALRNGQIVSRPDLGLSIKGKGTGRIFKGGVGRSANRLIIKIFGKEGAQNAMRVATTLKGIKPRPVPIIGPLIVLVTSLLSNEGVTHGLYKAFGAGIGGMLGGFIGAAGGPLAIVGMMLGELVGEWLGDLLYTLMHGGGVGAVSEKLKNQITTLWQDFLKPLGEWVANSVGRLWSNILESESLSMNVPKVLRRFLGGVERIPNPALFLNPVGWLLKGREMGGLLMKSFFPPQAEGDSQLKLNLPQVKLEDTSVKSSNGVEQSASYDSDQDEILVPIPLDAFGSQNPNVVSIPGKNHVIVMSSLNSYWKSRLMAELA